MDLKTLRAFINSKEVQALPDDTPVGCTGHYGEFCESYSDELAVKEVNKYHDKRRFTAVILPTVDIGPEPD